MENKRYIIAGILGLIVLVAIAGFIFQKFYRAPNVEQVTINQEVSTDDPMDIVLDFYEKWLDVAKSTSTDPYQSGLTAQPILSEALRVRLTETAGHGVGGLDPVLCQMTAPEHIVGRIVFKAADKTQVLVTAKDTRVTEQAIIMLLRHNDGWYIDDIACSLGESTPPREFSFDMEGYLLKNNVPPPLDPQYWHIVFSENNEAGHSAPLFFDAESMCESAGNVKAVCNPDQFIEATKVHVYGQMTERGVEVKQLAFVD